MFFINNCNYINDDSNNNKVNNNIETLPLSLSYNNRHFLNKEEIPFNNLDEFDLQFEVKRIENRKDICYDDFLFPTNELPQPVKYVNKDINIYNSTATKTLIPQPIPNKTNKKNILLKVKKNNNNSKKKNKSNTNDNLIMKIKRTICNHALAFVNQKLKNSKNEKLKKLNLLKINKSNLLIHKKEKNLEFFQNTLKDLFSNTLSVKYKSKDIYHNIKTINKILEENDEELNAILNTTIEYIVDIYSLKIQNKLFDDFIKIVEDYEIFMAKNTGKKEKKQSQFDIYNYYVRNIKKKLNLIPRRKKKYFIIYK